MVSAPTPACRAAASSASVLPGPVKTTRLGSKPARSTARSSPPEATSAPRPTEARVLSTAGELLALQAKAISTVSGMAARKAVARARSTSAS